MAPRRRTRLRRRAETRGLADRVTFEETDAAGYEGGYGHVSSPDECDDYEWSWTGALTEWALTEAGPQDRGSALAMAGTHREEWLAGYRGQLGFLTLVLRDTPH